MSEKIQPQNIEAEQSVLGAMLIDKDAIGKVTEILTADDFYRESHKVIFNAMLDIYNKNESVDLITVIDALRRSNKLSDIGGVAYVTSIADMVLTAANVKYHADIVAEKSVLRQLIRAATDIAVMGYESSDDVSTLVDKAEQMILNISNRKKSFVFTPITEVLMESVQQIEKLASNKG